MASMSELSLESVRDSLIRQEDSIVFAIIERAKFPLNSKAYNEPLEQCGGLPLVEFFVREAEALQAKVFVSIIFGDHLWSRSKGHQKQFYQGGRYQNPEENPFFPDNLPSPLLPPYYYPQVFHPSSASVSVNKDIWYMYFNEFLPLFTSEGDDGRYLETVAADLVCLQDNDALMKLLTFTKVEEMVKKRVANKATVFGQTVTLEDKVNNSDEGKCKVNPCVVSRLYADWIMPLTKIVEVEYLLHRLEK